jgi:hypothetical protein
LTRNWAKKNDVVQPQRIPSGIDESKIHCDRYRKMISVERYMKDYAASVPENLQGEWTRLIRRQSLLMLEWTAFYPSGATHRQPDYTDFYLPLIADFWGRILLIRQIR